MIEMTPQEAAEKIEKQVQFCRATCAGLDDKSFDYAISMLLKIAAGELKPVVHAHWIEENHESPRCSNCDKYALEDSSKEKVKSDYCPNCGALMDGTQ